MSRRGRDIKVTVNKNSYVSFTQTSKCNGAETGHADQWRFAETPPQQQRRSTEKLDLGTRLRVSGGHGLSFRTMFESLLSLLQNHSKTKTKEARSSVLAKSFGGGLFPSEAKAMVFCGLEFQEETRGILVCLCLRSFSLSCRVLSTALLITI